MLNRITLTDSYKVSHWKQYPALTNKIYSYWESRGGLFQDVVFFGLQGLINQYLLHSISQREVVEAEQLFNQHFGTALFNKQGWLDVIDYQKKNNYALPIIIKAIPEGTPVPVNNVLMTIENTDPRFYWLPNYLETLLSQLWYPSTVATLSRCVKQRVLGWLKNTGTPELIDFKLHDFGFRGVSSVESAGIGGAAHLINFKGTDTFHAINYIREYYPERDGATLMPGFSIPASEHSTITSWGRDHEVDAYRNMLDSYPEGLVAVVSDSYDIFNAVKNIWGGDLKQKVLERKGTLVVRPDSGDPITVCLKVIDELGEAFGYTVNEKGYRVLHPNVRVIQGDGVNYQSIGEILETLAKNNWSADNIGFGMGGGLLQNLNRDTQKFAFKCSYAEVNGEPRDVWKDPITDPGKTSKRGRLKLVKDDTGTYFTVPENDPRPNELVTYYSPQAEGDFETSFSEIRERAKV
jgi:nicotinamide phosphoribosyltransferase